MKIPELTWNVESPHPYDDDLLLNVDPVTIALLVRDRNAWNSTWVRHYLRNATLFADIASAKSAAENQRERGNVFYVLEAPAIQLRGMSSNVVLCDAHPDNPFGAFIGVGANLHQSKFGDWVDGIYPGISVKDAVEAFAHDSGHWSGETPSAASLRSGRIGTQVELSQGTERLASLESFARGTNYYLGWRNTVRQNRYVRAGVTRVAQEWNSALSAAGVVDALDDSTSQHLLRYRENVLKSLPKSVWLKLRADSLREQRAQRAQVSQAWLLQHERVRELKSAIWDAEVELAEAREDRLRPAETSSGMRIQRERLEAAQAQLQALNEELDQAMTRASEMRQQLISLNEAFRSVQ